MSVRLATMDDFERIMQNYITMTEYPGQVDSGAGWVVDIYPDRQMIQDAIESEHYFVAELNKVIVGGMSLNDAYTEGYEKVNWQVEAKAGEFLSIHALGIMPEARGNGLAKALATFAVEYAQTNNFKAIRIDVYGVNNAAKKLYPSVEFKLVDTVELYYEDTGLAEYLMYEYVI